jgi:hypothetical protein
MSRNGNVRREEKLRAEEIPQFERGDVVALTAAVIRRRDYANMTPRLLYEIGHPNEFHVLRSFEHKGQPHITLVDCCSWEKQEGLWDDHEGFIDRETGSPRCTGHPAILFQKIKKIRMTRKGDKSTSIHIPFIEQALAALRWEEDENSPALKAQVLGKEISLTGPVAKLVKQLAEENNIL